ncbi:MAG: excinuclease ABC subunit UvrC [Marinilabiliaceae bacterium]|nr:excinuclease ABC subunit UvrC [Marinilabiliaceae bacterium]
MDDNELDTSERIRAILSTLPEYPGIYQFFNDEGVIIYVGKAKNLKRRVSSYFNRIADHPKTRVLVRKVVDIQHIVVDTEEDALLLENNLIKKHQPRYNVLLKDDKTYPWIVVKNEPFPRVFQTRQLVRDGSSYFGPYTSGTMVRTLLDLFKQLYPLRTCNHALYSENIAAGKFKVCLEYHLGNCKGPCVGEYDVQSYSRNIESIRSILKGNVASVLKYMKGLMTDYADSFQFELAHDIKQKIAAIENFQSKSTIVNPKINDVDVLSIIDDDKSAYVNFLKVANGSIIQAHTVEYRKRLNETCDELFPMAIVELREQMGSRSPEIIVPFVPDVILKGVEFVVPKIGDKKKLLELSERNVIHYRLEKLRQQSIMKRETNEERIMSTLKKDLRLEKMPVHIECFDNSNIQGTHAVAACVVFKNGKPSKKDYRHFNVKTVEGPDDFASMREIIHRRYRRLLDEGSLLPQLIVIDGGKGQLGSAVQILNDLGIRDVAIIGIAKRLEEIFFPGDPVPLYLDKNSESLKIIQYLRNEAHRFGITFHRNKRSSDFLKSELDHIKGIGDSTVKKLLSSFQSIDDIRLADLTQLTQVLGKSKAQLVYDYYHHPSS